jgi:hypothetical protein
MICTGYSRLSYLLRYPVDTALRPVARPFLSTFHFFLRASAKGVIAVADAISVTHPWWRPEREFGVIDVKASASPTTDCAHAAVQTRPLCLWEAMRIPYALQQAYGALAWHVFEDGRRPAQCSIFRS